MLKLKRYTKSCSFPGRFFVFLRFYAYHHIRCRRSSQNTGQFRYSRLLLPALGVSPRGGALVITGFFYAPTKILSGAGVRRLRLLIPRDTVQVTRRLALGLKKRLLAALLATLGGALLHFGNKIELGLKFCFLAGMRRRVILTRHPLVYVFEGRGRRSSSRLKIFCCGWHHEGKAEDYCRGQADE